MTIDPTQSLSSNSNLIGSVSYRNYLALHDRALTTLNSNSLHKNNSYAGATEAVATAGAHSTNNYLDSDTKHQQQHNLLTNNYNSRSKSVSVLLYFKCLNNLFY